MTEVKFLVYSRPDGCRFQYSLTKQGAEAVTVGIQNIQLFGSVEEAKNYLWKEFHPHLAQRSIQPYIPANLNLNPIPLETIAFLPSTQGDEGAFHHYVLRMAMPMNIHDGRVEAVYLDPLVFDSEKSAKDFLKREFHRGIDVEENETKWMALPETILEQYEPG